MDVKVVLSHGRLFLSVNEILLAMQTDICRDGAVLEYAKLHRTAEDQSHYDKHSPGAWDNAALKSAAELIQRAPDPACSQTISTFPFLQRIAEEEGEIERRYEKMIMALCAKLRERDHLLANCRYDPERVPMRIVYE